MPARLRDIIRAFKALGGDVEESRGGSSHFRAIKDGRTYPLAAKNSAKTELSDVYIRGLCRCFDIDEDEFRKLL